MMSGRSLRLAIYLVYTRYEVEYKGVSAIYDIYVAKARREETKCVSGESPEREE